MNPINIAIDAVVRCVICNKKPKDCNCWKECKCGWSYKNKKGESCANPIHIKVKPQLKAYDEIVNQQPKEKL